MTEERKNEIISLLGRIATLHIATDEMEQRGIKYSEVMEFLSELSYPDDTFKRKMAGLAKKYHITHQRDIEWHNFVAEVEQLTHPELRESENEKIRKSLAEYHKRQLEKNRDQEVGLFHKNAIAWLEKQKEASKAIEAVEKIDKYIDEHLANAHDMKDSNPDKKYYRGWDDALAKMSGILQDVYSGEKRKERKDYRKLYEDIAQSEWFKKTYVGKSLGEEFEQMPAEWSEEDEKHLIWLCRIIHSRVVNKELSLAEESELGKWIDKWINHEPQPVQKWDEFDEDCLKRAVWYVENPAPSVVKDTNLALWLKSLSGRFNLEPKQEWSEEDEKKMIFLERLIEHNVPDGQYGWADGRKGGFVTKSEAISMLKSLRPVSKESLQSWKPSEEQMKALLNAEGCLREGDQFDSAKSIAQLYEQLKKL